MSQAEINRIYKIVLEIYKINYTEVIIKKKFKEILFNNIINNLLEL